MTLDQWCKQAGVLPTHPTTETGAVSVLVGKDTPCLSALWCLEDFVVRSRAGVVVWLAPKTNRTAPCPSCG